MDIKHFKHIMITFFFISSLFYCLIKSKVNKIYFFREKERERRRFERRTNETNKLLHFSLNINRNIQKRKKK